MSANANSANDAIQMAQVANKANQAFHKVSSSIPQGTKDLLNSAKAKILDSDKLRSFSDCFGMGEGPSRWSLPLNPTILCPRVKNNLLFFYLNYILLAAVVLGITVLATMMNPTTLIMLAVLVIVWIGVIRATSDEGLKLGPIITITRKTATTLLTIITAVVLFFMMKDVFYVTLCSSAILALVHAMVRNDTVYSSKGGQDDNSDVDTLSETQV